MGKPSVSSDSTAASSASLERSDPSTTRKGRSKQREVQVGSEAKTGLCLKPTTSASAYRQRSRIQDHKPGGSNRSPQEQDRETVLTHVLNKPSHSYNAIPVPLIASLEEGPTLSFKAKEFLASRSIDAASKAYTNDPPSLCSDDKLTQAIEAAKYASSAAVRILNEAAAVQNRESQIDADISASKSGALGSHKANIVQPSSLDSELQVYQLQQRGSNGGMSSRPGAGRRAGRDSGKDGDLETELLNRVLEAVRKAKEYNDESQRLGTEILALEEEIKTKGRSTPEQHRKLDDLYRKKMRNAEAEKKVHDEEDIVNNLAILATMRSTEEPAPRGGHVQKSRGKASKASVESDVADSPGPSPSDARVDILKRTKGASQRSSSVASQNRSGTALKDDDTHKGLQAEKAGQLLVGTEVFYKFPKGSPDDLGVGIQCIIKKIWQDKKPVIYDVQDPEPDPSGKQNVHKATARDLIPIPASSASLPTFAVGTTVYARYPDTDTFYRAKVRAVQKGEYTLRFEGEEDDKEQPVEKRFVLDTRMR